MVGTMRHLCPYCDWPEFSPVYQIEQSARRWFGLMFRKSGKVVHCTRCARQYAIGETGAYKIAAERDVPAQPSPVRPQKESPLSLVDEDTAALWK